MTFRGGRKKQGRAYFRPARDIMLELLETRTLTLRQAERICQRDYETVRKAMSKLKADDLVHIVEWNVPSVGPHEAVWALGCDNDEPNPPRLTPSVRSRRYREQRKPPVLKNRDPLLAALIGAKPSACRDSTMAQ